MWKNILKKLVIGSLCALQLSVIAGSMIVSAQTIRPTSAKQCSPQEAFRNWSEFLSAVASYEGFTEYWKEVLGYHSSCQYNDILAVHKKIDAIEKRIRTSFYACNNQAVDKLKPQYHKARAELFYVRNFVETKDGRLVPRNDQLLKTQMLEDFVKSRRVMGETELDKYFEEFKKKYASKNQEYAKCDDNQWKQVSKKWKELKENFKSLGGDLDKEFKAGQKQIADADKTKNAPQGKGKSFLERTFSFTVNGQKPGKGFAQIGAEITKKAKEVVPRPPTLNQVGEAFARDQQVRLEKITKQEMLDRYTTRYKQGGDEALADLIVRMQGLNTTVKDTIPVLGKLGQCSQKIAKKQCK